jgi:hypothetical protein
VDACDCTQTDSAAADFCGVDLDGNGIIETDEKTVFTAADLKHPEVLTGLSLTNGDAEQSVLVFDSVRGMVAIDPELANRAEIQLVSTGGAYALNVTISPTGRLGICSPGTDDHALVPGYELCQ